MSTEEEKLRTELGTLRERVVALERDFVNMNDNIKKMSDQLDTLVALANRSRGGLWAIMSMTTTLGALAGWVISLLHSGGKP